MAESSSQLPATISQKITPGKEDIAVSASTVAEMQVCQRALTLWAVERIAGVKQEHSELVDALESAKKNKWGTKALQRQVIRLEKRITFYEKMKSALEQGYTVVPNFPVTAFAIRTNRKNPLKVMTTNWNKSHTQEASGLPEGEGEYKNPFPVVEEETIAARTQTTDEEKIYWAEAWKDLEFPLSMAKPHIIEATTRAMALKVFDDIGILPGYAPGEGTKPPKADPIIVARIKDGSRSDAYHKTWVTFMVAWYLDTRTL